MQTRSSPNRDTLLRYCIRTDFCSCGVRNAYVYTRRLATRMGVNNVDRLPKSVLFNRLRTEYNFERLLRAEYRNLTTKRKREDKTPSPVVESQKAQKLNTIDPIMLTVIPRNARTFKFSRPNGTVVQFNVATLVDYLLATGDFTDPETRIPFTDKDLQDIDALVRQLAYCDYYGN